MTKALVLFSGGQDSTSCLFYALEHFDEVETLGVQYGQRHQAELQARKNILHKIETEFPKYKGKLKKDIVVNLSDLGKVSESALLSDAKIEMNVINGLPTSFVPARNLVFLMVAGGRAYSADCDAIVTGVCEQDYSGYPDCRESTIKATENALALGLERKITIITPLMHITKAQTWQMVEDIAGKKAVDFIVRETHTCYEGDHSHFYEWGYGCGECPACKLREKGYREYFESKK